MDADTTSAETDVTVNRQSEEAVSSTTEGDHPASEAYEEGGSGYAGNEGTGKIECGILENLKLLTKKL